MVLPARADLEVRLRGISSSANYKARPEEESRIRAHFHITGSESVLDANSPTSTRLETEATENMDLLQPRFAPRFTLP
jgi:hypothetical protein